MAFATTKVSNIKNLLLLVIEKLVTYLSILNCLCFAPQLTLTYSKLTLETLEQGVKRQNNDAWRCCGVFIVNFEHILHLALVILLLSLNV